MSPPWSTTLNTEAYPSSSPAPLPAAAFHSTEASNWSRMLLLLAYPRLVGALVVEYPVPHAVVIDRHETVAAWAQQATHALSAPIPARTAGVVVIDVRIVFQFGKRLFADGARVTLTLAERPVLPGSDPHVPPRIIAPAFRLTPQDLISIPVVIGTIPGPPLIQVPGTVFAHVEQLRVPALLMPGASPPARGRLPAVRRAVCRAASWRLGYDAAAFRAFFSHARGR